MTNQQHLDFIYKIQLEPDQLFPAPVIPPYTDHSHLTFALLQSFLIVFLHPLQIHPYLTESFNRAARVILLKYKANPVTPLFRIFCSLECTFLCPECFLSRVNVPLT